MITQEMRDGLRRRRDGLRAGCYLLNKQNTPGYPDPNGDETEEAFQREVTLMLVMCRTGDKMVLGCLSGEKNFTRKKIELQLTLQQDSLKNQTDTEGAQQSLIRESGEKKNKKSERY